jgi:hypothetical protein
VAELPQQVSRLTDQPDTGAVEAMRPATSPGRPCMALASELGAQAHQPGPWPAMRATKKGYERLEHGICGTDPELPIKLPVKLPGVRRFTQLPSGSPSCNQAAWRGEVY